jgi:hypothetical protein
MKRTMRELAGGKRRLVLVTVAMGVQRWRR